MQTETTKNCQACGEEILATAKKCKHCGEWLQTQQKQAVTVTGRTESMVSQVAPQYENEQIRFKECFGWNLSGRQEMAVEGDTKVNLDWNGNVIASTDVSKYVKLHFTRSLDLPNLGKIRELESEFEKTKIPQLKGLGCAALLLIFSGVLAYISISERKFTNELGVYFGVAALGALWLYWNMQKNTGIRKLIEQGLQKKTQLMEESKNLLT